MFEEYHISGAADYMHIDSNKMRYYANIKVDGFVKGLLQLPSIRCLDLLYIAVGIYSVYRISNRRKRIDNECGIRQLHLTFEVNDIEFWASQDINNLLLNIISFLTGDDWIFDFVKSQQPSVRQDFLDLSRDAQPKHAALYSGGLDSAAGLINRFFEGKNDFMLISVGHNKLHGHIIKQLQALKFILNKNQDRQINILHSTLTVSLQGRNLKPLSNQEKTQRSRSFMFCAVSAIAAKVYGLNAVEIFENGVGAINLPLMTGMLGNGLATRSAHPTFLKYMSELSSQVIESSLTFVLPFINKTKAEMLHVLKGYTDLENWAQQSRSCVHTSLRDGSKRNHCGCCPACIERRQAFISEGVKENMDDYLVDIVSQPLTGHGVDYLRLYQLDAMQRIEKAGNVQRRMNNHLRLTDIPFYQDGQINALQLRHSHEVSRTYGAPFS